MMMTPISPNATQAKLNMERLKAVRERIQDTNKSVNSQATQVFSQNLQDTQNTPNLTTDPEALKPLQGRVDAPPPPQKSVLLSPELRQQDYSRFQTQAQIQESPLNDAVAIQAPSHRVLPQNPSLPQGRYGLPLGDIQSIAEKAGFVGVDQSAIERAYATRKSLFVDIKI